MAGGRGAPSTREEGGDLAGVEVRLARWRADSLGLSSRVWISCCSSSSSWLLLLVTKDLGSLVSELLLTSAAGVLSLSLFLLDLKDILSIVLWNKEVFSFFLKTLILSTAASFSSMFPTS